MTGTVEFFWELNRALLELWISILCTVLLCRHSMSVVWICRCICNMKVLFSVYRSCYWVILDSRMYLWFSSSSFGTLFSELKLSLKLCSGLDPEELLSIWHPVCTHFLSPTFVGWICVVEKLSWLWNQTCAIKISYACLLDIVALAYARFTYRHSLLYLLLCSWSMTVLSLQWDVITLLFTSSS